MSVIDIPRDTLDPMIWDCSVPNCKLRDEVKKTILDTLRLFFINTINDAQMEKYIQNIYLTGSSATFQWREDSDIDITVVVKTGYDPILGESFADSWQYKELKENISKVNSSVFVGKHPINYYFTFTFVSQAYDAVYDILRDVWVKRPPELTPFDPRMQFLFVWHKIEDWCEDVDELVMEMRRDVIDYRYIHSLLNELPEKYWPALLNMLNQRLTELNQNIQELIDKYNELHAERKISFEGLDSLSDEELISANWLPDNIRYKFAERYKYNQLAKALWKILSNNPIINTPEEVDEVATQLNLFFEIPKKTKAALFSYLTKQGRKKEYPFKFMRKKLRKNRNVLPIEYPYGFMITEDNIANEIEVTEMEGFNTMSENKPVPSNRGYQANPQWETADSLLMVPASLEKLAQEPDMADMPTDVEVSDAIEPVIPEPTTSPAAQELRRILEPSSDDFQQALTPAHKETPEDYFKSVKENIPEVAKKLTDYDKWLYYALEKKRVEAINKLDIATLRTIDGEIEKLIEKYSEPVPIPEPISQSTELAASIKHIGSMMDEAVENLYAYLAKVGLLTKDIRLGYTGEQTYEFILDVPVRLQITNSSFSVTGIQDTISTMTYKPVIVKVSKEGTVIPYMWTLDGKRYDLTSEGVKELLNTLQGEVSDTFVNFVVGV